MPAAGGGAAAAGEGQHLPEVAPEWAHSNYAVLRARRGCFTLHGGRGARRGPPKRRFAVHSLWPRMRPRPLRAHQGCVNTVAWDTTGDFLISGSDDRHLCLWRAGTWQLRCRHRTPHSANILSALPLDSTTIVSGGMDGAVALNFLEVGQERSCVVGYSSLAVVHRLARQSHTTVLGGCSDGALLQIDTRISQSGRPTHCYVERISGEVPIVGVAVSPACEHVVACCGGDRYVRLYDLRAIGDGFRLQRSCFARLGADSAGSHFPVEHPQRMSGCAFGDVCVFDTRGIVSAQPLAATAPAKRPAPGGAAEAQSAKRPRGAEDTAAAPALAAVGNALQAASSEQEVSGQLRARLQGHRNVKTAKEVCFVGTESEWVLSGSDDGALFCWRWRDAQIEHIFAGADPYVVNGVAPHPLWSAGVVLFASCGIDDDVRVWQPGGECEPYSERLVEYIGRCDRNRRLRTQGNCPTDIFDDDSEQHPSMHPLAWRALLDGGDSGSSEGEGFDY
eukprot:TRINITY_DN32017_c0_g1_i2.p1 TRINITY_DN32017_c0_g1~~TRINITY_DN32017_c0_g1_i2.p1  ORF type:complete len:529 (+),score=97.34 TRINITY_DN32017_c0_g1_i2:75-1589(+)